MIGESLAIVIVLLVMVVMYRRAGKKLLSRLALPLICVPCSRLVGVGIVGLPSQAAGNLVSNCLFVLLGLVLSIGFCLLAAKAIDSRGARISYLVLSVVFSGALAVAYLF